MKSHVVSPRRHAVPVPEGIPRITPEERCISSADARVILHRTIAERFPQVQVLGIHGEDGLHIGVPEDDPGLLERLKAKLNLVSGPLPGPASGEPVRLDLEPTAAAVAEAHAAKEYRPTVVGLLRDRKGNFLLLQSRHSAAEWMFLQGGIEPGESPAAALVREAREELGIDGSRISGLNPLGVWDLDVEKGRADTRGFTKGKRFLRGFFRQRMLDRFETAFLRHAALGADIGVARGILADDDDGETRLDAGLVFQRHGRGLHGVNHGSGNLLPIDNGGHISLPE